jgi:hypothetical protein
MDKLWIARLAGRYEQNRPDLLDTLFEGCKIESAGQICYTCKLEKEELLKLRQSRSPETDKLGQPQTGLKSQSG